MAEITDIWKIRDQIPEEDFFEYMRQMDRKKGEIHEDMTPDEIAEIVSEALMANIRKQFAEARERYLESLKNKKSPTVRKKR